VNSIKIVLQNITVLHREHREHREQYEQYEQLEQYEHFEQMNNEFRYILEPYKGLNSRVICPSCQSHFQKSLLIY
jgi:hypothetical protein